MTLLFDCGFIVNKKGIAFASGISITEYAKYNTLSENVTNEECSLNLTDRSATWHLPITPETRVIDAQLSLALDNW